MFNPCIKLSCKNVMIFFGLVQLKLCVLQILRFTSLLIEHSFSRTVYNSMDHLTELLYSSDLTLLLENLHLLFMFSKRSNLLTRLPDDKRALLLEGLYALAEVSITTIYISILYNEDN